MVQEPYHEAGLSPLLLYFYVQWVISPPCARPGHQGAKLAVLSRKDGRALYLPLRTAGSLVEPHLAAQAARHGMVRVRDLEPHAEGAARRVNDLVHDGHLRRERALGVDLGADLGAHPRADRAEPRGRRHHLDPQRIDLHELGDGVVLVYHPPGGGEESTPVPHIPGARLPP